MIGAPSQCYFKTIAEALRCEITSSLFICANFVKVEHPHKEGLFVPAPPLKDAIVMNVGDLLQRWSNGRLPDCLVDFDPIVDIDAFRHSKVYSSSCGPASKARSFHRR